MAGKKKDIPKQKVQALFEGAVITFVDITERKRAEEALEKASDDIRALHGILPICANCKNIRDDRGYWNQVEVYIRDHSEAEFSHGICPECIKKLYPTLKQNGGKALEMLEALNDPHG